MTLPLTIPALAALAAKRFGEADAVRERGESWSYVALWHRIEAAARAFIANGVQAGDRVAIWAPNRREWIVAAVAAQAAGASIVPLNTRLKGREAGDILRRTHASMLFTVSAFLGTDYVALLAAQSLPDLRRTILFDRDWDAFVAEGSDAPDGAVATTMARLSEDDVSDIMFTSGTTGTPKGVLTSHAAIIPMFRNWGETVGLSRGDRYLVINPFFHSFGFKAGWVAALIAGATILPVETFDTDAVLDTIERERVSFLPGPPTIYQSMLARTAERPRNLSSLRVAVTGAATVPPVLIRRMLDELGFEVVLTAYGMTECSNITTCRQGDAPTLVAESCGKAVPGLEVIIADDDGREIPRGGTGEILVRGRGVMLGYLDDAAATAEAIDTGGWLHTGDIGTMDEDGYVSITDRKKDIYISGGFNCYPAEIEKLLSEHPAVQAVAVIGVPDERMGEVGHAFVVPRAGTPITGDNLRTWARETMANYKVPRAVVLVDDLPRNAGGKVVKAELREMVS